MAQCDGTEEARVIMSRLRVHQPLIYRPSQDIIAQGTFVFSSFMSSVAKVALFSVLQGMRREVYGAGGTSDTQSADPSAQASRDDSDREALQASILLILALVQTAWGAYGTVRDVVSPVLSSIVGAPVEFTDRLEQERKGWKQRGLLERIPPLQVPASVDDLLCVAPTRYSLKQFVQLRSSGMWVGHAAGFATAGAFMQSIGVAAAFYDVSVALSGDADGGLPSNSTMLNGTSLSQGNQTALVPSPPSTNVTDSAADILVGVAAGRIAVVCLSSPIWCVGLMLAALFVSVSECIGPCTGARETSVCGGLVAFFMSVVPAALFFGTVAGMGPGGAAATAAFSLWIARSQDMGYSREMPISEATVLASKKERAVMPPGTAGKSSGDKSKSKQDDDDGDDDKKQSCAKALVKAMGAYLGEYALPGVKATDEGMDGINDASSATSYTLEELYLPVQVARWLAMHVVIAALSDVGLGLVLLLQSEVVDAMEQGSSLVGDQDSKWLSTAAVIIGITFCGLALVMVCASWASGALAIVMDPSGPIRKVEAWEAPVAAVWEALAMEQLLASYDPAILSEDEAAYLSKDEGLLCFRTGAIDKLDEDQRGHGYTAPKLGTKHKPAEITESGCCGGPKAPLSLMFAGCGESGNDAGPAPSPTAQGPCTSSDGDGGEVVRMGVTTASSGGAASAAAAATTTAGDADAKKPGHEEAEDQGDSGSATQPAAEV